MTGVGYPLLKRSHGRRGEPCQFRRGGKDNATIGLPQQPAGQGHPHGTLGDAGEGKLVAEGEGVACRIPYVLSLTQHLGSRVLKLPESASLVFNFPFEKTLRKSVAAVVVLADAENPQTCAFRGVTEYIFAALAIGWDLTAGYLFPMVERNGERGSMAITAPRMTAALQAHLRAGGLPDHSTMLSFRVGGPLSKSLAGKVVDEIMKVGGWKTERVTRYYIGSTTGAVATLKGKRKREGGSQRARDQSYATAVDFPLSQACQDDFSACKQR